MQEIVMLQHDENNLRGMLRLRKDDLLPDEIHEAYAWMRAMMGGSGEITNPMLMTICLKADLLKAEKRVAAQAETIKFLQGNGLAPLANDDEEPYSGDFFAKGTRVTCRVEDGDRDGDVVLHESNGYFVRVDFGDEGRSYQRIGVADVREPEPVSA